MLILILKRVLISIPLLFVVSVLVFVLQSFIPGDAAQQIAGPQASPEMVEKLREALGLNLPVWEQYARWLGEVLHGSLGTSLLNGQPVIDALNQRLPTTLSLVIGSTVIATIVGVVLGVISSRGKGAAARFIDVLSIAGLAVPGFWLALLLITVFSVQLGIFPATGYVAFADSPSEWLRSLALPVAALSLTGVTAIAKQTREAMLDVQASDFIRNLRANGIPESAIVFRHALRSSAVRIVTISGLLFIGALGGSVVIEQVFGLPGLGTLAVSATTSKDLPMIQGIAVYFTLIVIVVNLATDIAYGWINPKVRTS
ncbi:ABC transporter permease [Homoserinibacter sp. GY 40078]|uniref:ABC transporter permease n=1 Tax=Homoserinibacter sp. GY 40078 TaxID=2603275 RepID=UPI0011C8D9B8|nr:ABC transporter permease [Homoserinibacter sp. GY 40078]TXK19306.1 ABC transporter permease [Homoserinibacter sp. GY 40078]